MNEISVLVDNIEKHRHVLFSKQNTTITNSKKNILWKSITENVNATGVGFVRTPDEIRKKWSQLCSGVKTKAAQIRVECNRTGGGLSFMTGLTPIEERIAGIMGPTAIAGIEEGLDTCMKSERTSRMETKQAAETVTLPLLASFDAGSAAALSTEAAEHVFFVNTPYDVEPTNIISTSVETTDSQYDETLPVIESRKRKKEHPSEPPVERQLLCVEEKRLDVETQRLRVEEKRLAVEEERLAIAKELLEIKKQKFSLYLSNLAGIAPTVQYSNE